MFELLADVGGVSKYLESYVVPIVGCLLIFYFVLMRPQAKKQKEMDQYLANLTKGDEVMTTAGLYGKIHEDDKKSSYVILELQDKVRVKMLRSAIVGKPAEEKPVTKKEENKK